MAPMTSAAGCSRSSLTEPLVVSRAHRRTGTERRRRLPAESPDLDAHHEPLKCLCMLCPILKECTKWSHAVRKGPCSLIVNRQSQIANRASLVPSATAESAMQLVGHTISSSDADIITLKLEMARLMNTCTASLLDVAEALGVPVIVHPADLAVPPRHRRLFLHILAGNPSETTYAAAALLLGGVFDRFPKLRVLLVHGGGCVPYQFGRLARGRVASPPAARGAAKLDLDRYADNLYYDTILHDDAALRYLISRVSAHRVALGSDYPFPLRDADPVLTVQKQEMSEALERAVCWGTGAELLGLG